MLFRRQAGFNPVLAEQFIFLAAKQLQPLWVDESDPGLIINGHQDNSNCAKILLGYIFQSQWRLQFCIVHKKEQSGSELWNVH